MAKNQFLDWDTTASANTDIGGIGILGTNAVNNFDDALRTIMAQLRSGVDGEVVYAAKSTNYTATVTDNNAMLRFTAAATLGLNTAASLGSGWHISIIADGGAVTIDPNGSQTINGQTTQVIPNGSTASIICDGTAFYTEIRPAAWEFIRTVTGTGTPTQLTFVDLASFHTLRLHGQLSGSATTFLFFRVSVDNGSSYESGASDYGMQVRTIQNATQTGASTTGGTAVQIGPSSGVGSRAYLDLTVTKFNQAANTQVLSNLGGIDASSAIFKTDAWGYRNAITVNNAFALVVTAGTFLTWDLRLEGIRG